VVGIGAALVVFVASVVAFGVLQWVWAAAGEHDLTVPERMPFAGGAEPEFHAWNRFHIRYYAMALLFLAFDMEMVFMYPWAAVFVREGLIALIEMLMFILILIVGMVYAWREKSFEWA
jgi:NADH:ubiquinone oxidoreductase subunit 3 (subunit A)